MNNDTQWYKSSPTLLTGQQSKTFLCVELQPMKEAIVLCGGQKWMLRQDAQVPKPLLSLGEQTLIERQVHWLTKCGFKRIVLAVDKDLLGYMMLRTDVYKKLKQIKTTSVNMSIEDTMLGTGGAMKKASQQVENEVFYACNVDDLALNFNPEELLKLTRSNNVLTVLLAKPTLRFGKVKIQDGYIRRFQEKPKLDFYVSAGHYSMNKRTVFESFPNRGNFEDKILPKLAGQNRLMGFQYHGEWVTIETFNDYLNALSLFGP